jgi:hypothetical protein
MDVSMAISMVTPIGYDYTCDKKDMKCKKIF